MTGTAWRAADASPANTAAGTAPATDARSPHGTYRAVRIFGSLDGLRCLCLSMVLWHHGIWATIPDVPWC